MSTSRTRENASERALEDEEARLAAASLAAGDPTGWFDRLYAAGTAGRVPIPRSRSEPHPLLTEWAQRHHLAGQGKRAIASPRPSSSGRWCKRLPGTSRLRAEQHRDDHLDGRRCAGRCRLIRRGRGWSARPARG
jgi:hypothetical protein